MFRRLLLRVLCSGSLNSRRDLGAFPFYCSNLGDFAEVLFLHVIQYDLSFSSELLIESDVSVGCECRFHVGRAVLLKWRGYLVECCE